MELLPFLIHLSDFGKCIFKFKFLSNALISRIICSQIFLAFYREVMKYAFLLEKKPNFRATQWYIYFSSIRIQTWLLIALSLGVYSNFSTIRFIMQILWKTGVFMNKIPISMRFQMNIKLIKNANSVHDAKLLNDFSNKVGWLLQESLPGH